MMSEISQQDRESYTQHYQQLLQNQKTLLLSTVSDEGEPECSYAPYVKDQDGVFYIFVSELATHTKNLLNHLKASILFIQPEQEANNLFARERITFSCLVKEIKKDNVLYNEQLNKMDVEFGQTIALLRRLPDFHLLALKPVKGKYVMGFGKAFKIDMSDGSLVFKVDVK